MGLLRKPAAAPAKAGAVKKVAAPAKAGGVVKKTAAAPAKTGGVKKIGTKRAEPEDDDGEDYDDIAATSGWAGAEKLRSEQSTFAPTLKIKDGEAVAIAFLEDAPYANVSTHWMERKGRRSFLCIGARCPLCASGDTPRVTYNFNVAKITDGDPVVYSLEAGARVLKQIEEKAKAKTGPLTKKLYVLSRTGAKMNDTVYSLSVVRRDDDLLEDFPDLNIPSRDELNKLKVYSLDDVRKQRSSLKELQDIADEALGEFDGADDDDD